MRREDIRSSTPASRLPTPAGRVSPSRRVRPAAGVTIGKKFGVHLAAGLYLARTAASPLGSADLDALRAARARSSRLGLTRAASLRALGSPKQFLSAVPHRLFRDPAAASLVRRTGARSVPLPSSTRGTVLPTCPPAASLRRTAPPLYERLQPDSPRPMPSSSSCRRPLLSFLVKVAA
ncbi:hypothetical protein DAI22_05g015250 [Oryza sativa Japonica Group]|nr:hypothetical protein DAI22_05g015250 [Oryza sativa Japonica Group]